MEYLRPQFWGPFYWHVYVLDGPAQQLTKTRDVIASATDMCIVYHVTSVEASRNINLGMRYDSWCVGMEWGGGEIKKSLSCDRSTGSCICLLCVSVIFCRQGHIHDPVLLSQDRNYTFVFVQFVIQPAGKENWCWYDQLWWWYVIIHWHYCYWASSFLQYREEKGLIVVKWMVYEVTAVTLHVSKVLCVGA